MTFDVSTPPTDLAAFIEDAKRANREMPNGYNRVGWAVGPVGQHRDSDSLAKSNFKVALAEMVQAAGMDPDDIDEMPSSGPACLNCNHPMSAHDETGKCEGVWTPGQPPIVRYGRVDWDSPQPCAVKCETPQTVALYIGGFNHWGVGWIEEILWRADNAELAAAAFDIFQRLEDYPVLSDDDYSETEWADNHPGDGLCYADPREYGECGCDNESIYESEDQ